MGNQHNGCPCFIGELLEQTQDLRLNGYVKRCCWFICDQKLGLAGKAMAIITRWHMPPES